MLEWVGRFWFLDGDLRVVVVVLFRDGLVGVVVLFVFVV